MRRFSGKEDLMGTELETVESGRVRKEARPWAGFFLGLILGLAIAVILQQAGIWPLDRLLLFGSAGVFALVGILLGGAGRERVGSFSTITPLVLAVALIGYGATGLGSLNENGELNGGCTVEAASDADTTIVTDTSRQDPFEVDPDGGLSWLATSPGPITNHFWEIYVDVGGFPVVVADNEEVEPNTNGDLDNTGDVDDVSGYIEEVSNYAGVELAGVFEVGGDIEGEGGACDGFGFVTLTADPLSTLISQIAAVIGLLALIGLLTLVFNRTERVAIVEESEVRLTGTDAGPTAGMAGAAGAAAPATEGADEDRPTRGGAHIRPDDTGTDTPEADGGDEG
jgi:hypothetical protein